MRTLAGWIKGEHLVRPLLLPVSSGALWDESRQHVYKGGQRTPEIVYCMNRAVSEGHTLYRKPDICTPILHGITFIKQETDVREKHLQILKTVRSTNLEWPLNEPLSSCGCIVDWSLRGQQFRRRAGKSITYTIDQT